MQGEELRCAGRRVLGLTDAPTLALLASAAAVPATAEARKHPLRRPQPKEVGCELAKVGGVRSGRGCCGQRAIDGAGIEEIGIASTGVCGDVDGRGV